MVKKKSKTKEQLEREVLELKAQLSSTYYYASKGVEKAKNLTAGTVILQISGLGGKEIIEPVAIKDGLSEETVEAIKKDLRRSYELSIGSRP